MKSSMIYPPSFHGVLYWLTQHGFLRQEISKPNRSIVVCQFVAGPYLERKKKSYRNQEGNRK